MEARKGADPEVASAVLEEGAHVVVGEALLRRPCCERAVLQPLQAAGGADPEGPFTVREQGAYAIGDESIFLPERSEMPLPVSVEPVLLRSRPDRALRVLDQAPHEILGEPFGGRIARGDTIREAHQAASGPEPEGAAAVDQGAGETVVDELREGTPVVGREADPVEPDEAYLVREPQVPILGLGDVVDHVRGEARFSLPRAVHVLGDGLGGVEREGGGSRHQARQHRRCHPACARTATRLTRGEGATHQPAPTRRG